MDRERPEGGRHPVPRRALTRYPSPCCRGPYSPSAVQRLRGGWLHGVDHVPGAVMPYPLRQAVPKSGHPRGSIHTGTAQVPGPGARLRPGPHALNSDPQCLFSRAANAATVWSASYRARLNRRFTRICTFRSTGLNAAAAASVAAVTATWLPRTADRVIDGVARAAEACSLGGEERPRRPRRGVLRPRPAGHQPDGAGESQAGPQARLSCCPHAAAPNPGP